MHLRHTLRKSYAKFPNFSLFALLQLFSFLTIPPPYIFASVLPFKKPYIWFFDAAARVFYYRFLIRTSGFLDTSLLFEEVMNHRISKRLKIPQKCLITFFYYWRENPNYFNTSCLKEIENSRKVFIEKSRKIGKNRLISIKRHLANLR